MTNPKRWRWRRIIIATFAATVLVIAGIIGLNRPASAATYGEFPVEYATSWCITTGGGVGTADVLGVCAGAGSQEFTAVLFSGANQTYQLKNEASGLCITYDVANGGPDGAPALSGNCVGAQNQLFTPFDAYDGAIGWYMPYRKDAGGTNMAINNKNSQLEVYNPINESHESSGIPSESWAGPPGVGE
jgi:hypothetical protein